jgi:hypothetical protein
VDDKTMPIQQSNGGDASNAATAGASTRPRIAAGRRRSCPAFKSSATDQGPIGKHAAKKQDPRLEAGPANTGDLAQVSPSQAIYREKIVPCAYCSAQPIMVRRASEDHAEHGVSEAVSDVSGTNASATHQDRRPEARRHEEQEADRRLQDS